MQSKMIRLIRLRNSGGWFGNKEQYRFKYARRWNVLVFVLRSTAGGNTCLLSKQHQSICSMYLIHISPTNRCSGFPYVETPIAVWRQYSPKIYDTYFTSEQVGETGIGHTIYGKPEHLFVGEICIRYMLHIDWYCFDNKQVLLPAVEIGSSSAYTFEKGACVNLVPQSHRTLVNLWLHHANIFFFETIPDCLSYLNNNFVNFNNAFPSLISFLINLCHSHLSWTANFSYIENRVFSAKGDSNRIISAYMKLTWNFVVQWLP